MKFPNAFLYTNGGFRKHAKGKAWNGYIAHKGGDGKWRYKYKSFDSSLSKRDAETQLAAWQAAEDEVAKRASELSVVVPVDTALSDDLTVSAYVSNFIDARRAARELETESINSNITSLAYIRERFDNTLLRDLTTAQVQAMITGLCEQGYSASTVRKAYGLLSQACDRAELLGHIERSPCDKRLISLPKLSRSRVEAMDEKERARAVQILTSSVKPTETIVAALVALFAGLRVSETCALRWHDVDLENNLLTVAAAITKERGRGYFYRPSPKNGKSRIVPIGETLHKTLQTLHSMSDHFDKTDYVFGNDRFVSPSTMSRQWTTIATTFSLTTVTNTLCSYHALRHTFATTALAAGADVRTVSDILGHANPTVTLNIYASSTPISKQHCINLVDKSLNSHT